MNFTELLVPHSTQVKSVFKTEPEFFSYTDITGFRVFFIFLAGIAHKEKPLYGVQFHPEVDLSVKGIEILRNFLFDIAGCHGTYTMRSREASCIEYIKETAGNHKILVRTVFFMLTLCIN